ncbi:phosphoesterase [Mesorhizobium sp. RP14(2022)]|uniref:Phosphoesterase n=1 Tax=Mesorhizobium liriopis TaxID=2953882 RepID=A0ABT1C0Q4_9HYPH|nr:phosphoesterase [Mesorhizobium liriopis]MCO6048414.1 phosphoesterase [Mesorhizobium liriopis]
MITHVPPPDTKELAAKALFAEGIERFSKEKPILVMGHFDADGLSATAIFLRSLARAGWQAEPRIVGRGENAWSDAMRAEMKDADYGGLIVTDLGTSSGSIAPHIPTIVVDHHVPTGFPDEAVTISGAASDPIPTSSLLALRACAALGDTDDLLWLAAIGLIGDLADKDPWPELEAARARYGITALRNAVSLINAPRRASAADTRPALALLMKGEGPKDVTSGKFPETQALLAAKAEVNEELDRAKRVGPKVVGDVALVQFASPCQIHPLVAQSWRGRLKNKIVIAANTAYSPDRIHFAARTSGAHDLLEFFAQNRPPGADEQYGRGHRQASGGALKPADWRIFLEKLGFGDQP